MLLFGNEHLCPLLVHGSTEISGEEESGIRCPEKWWGAMPV